MSGSIMQKKYTRKRILLEESGIRMPCTVKILQLIVSIKGALVSASQVQHRGKERCT